MPLLALPRQPALRSKMAYTAARLQAARTLLATACRIGTGSSSNLAATAVSEDWVCCYSPSTVRMDCTNEQLTSTSLAASAVSEDWVCCYSPSTVRMDCTIVHKPGGFGRSRRGADYSAPSIRTTRRQRRITPHHDPPHHDDELPAVAVVVRLQQQQQPSLAASAVSDEPFLAASAVPDVAPHPSSTRRSSHARRAAHCVFPGGFGRFR